MSCPFLLHRTVACRVGTFTANEYIETFVRSLAISSCVLQSSNSCICWLFFFAWSIFYSNLCLVLWTCWINIDRLLVEFMIQVSVVMVCFVLFIFVKTNNNTSVLVTGRARKIASVLHVLLECLFFLFLFLLLLVFFYFWSFAEALQCLIWKIVLSLNVDCFYSGSCRKMEKHILWHQVHHHIHQKHFQVVLFPTYKIFLRIMQIHCHVYQTNHMKQKCCMW